MDAQQQLHDTIRAFIIEAAELDDDVQIDLDQTLDAHDVDSLAGMEIMVNLEKKFRIKIPAQRYQEMTTVRAIGGIVQELLDARPTTEVAA